MVAAGDIAQKYIPPGNRLEHPCDPFKQSMERLLVHRLCFCHPLVPTIQGTKVVLLRRTPTRICHFLPTDRTLSCLISTLYRQDHRALRIWGLVLRGPRARLEVLATCARNIPDTLEKQAIKLHVARRSFYITVTMRPHLYRLALLLSRQSSFVRP